MVKSTWLPNISISQCEGLGHGYSKPISSLNQGFAALQVTADAIQFGFAVYEGMRVYINNERCMIFRSRDHFERLVASCKALGLLCPSYEVFIDAIALAVSENDVGNVSCIYVRPIVFSSSGGIMPQQGSEFVFAVAATIFNKRKDNISVFVESTYPRTHPLFSTIKTASNYASSCIINNKVQKNGYDSILWLSHKGYIKECTTMNVFVYYKGVVYTPPLDSILPGITRKTFIELLEKEEEIAVIENDLHIDEVVDFIASDESTLVLTTSTALKINLVGSMSYKGVSYNVNTTPPRHIRNAINSYEAITMDFGNNLNSHSNIYKASHIFQKAEHYQ